MRTVTSKIYFIRKTLVADRVKSCPNQKNRELHLHDKFPKKKKMPNCIFDRELVHQLSNNRFSFFSWLKKDRMSTVWYQRK